MSLDILTTYHRFPETVHILATGPNGLPFHRKLRDSDMFIIAVNKAIEIPNVNKHLWLCADGTLPQKGWFRSAAEYYIQKSYPLMDNQPTPIFCEGVLYDEYPHVPYFYRHYSRSLSWEPVGEIISGYARGGGTISMEAAQIAVQKGAKKLFFIGVDMKDKAYFDDPEGAGCTADILPGGAWTRLTSANALLNYLREIGIEVYSLSPTLLDIQVITP